jgi:putative peptidoglycan lipid II flippase
MTSKYLIRNASISTFWQALGTVSGTVLDAVVLEHFGLGIETDALFASLAIPTLVTSALGIQIPKVLIPVLSRCTEKEGNEATSVLVSTLVTTFASVLCAGALLLSAFARMLIRIQAPGFQARTIHLGVRLFIVLIWLTFFQGVGPILQSFLFSRHRYVVPSLGKLMRTLPAILGLLFFGAKLGIYAVALGMVSGSILQLMLLGVAARANGLKWSLRWNPTDRRVREIVKMFGHPIQGHILSESKTLIENFLASLLRGGSLSVLRYATRIVEAISGVLLSGIVTSSLPLISADASKEKLGEMKKSLLDAIRLILFLALPIACWLIFTSQPLIVLLYQRGEFSNIDASHTALLIALATPYIIFSRLIGIAQTPFYANLDTKTPLLSALVFFGLYITIVVILSKTLGIYGFPIASSFASLMTAVIMSALLHRRFGPLGCRVLKKFGKRMSIAIGFMICALIIGHGIGTHFLSESLADKLIRFLVPTALGFTAFLGASVGFRLLGRRHLDALASQ